MSTVATGAAYATPTSSNAVVDVAKAVAKSAVAYAGSTDSTWPAALLAPALSATEGSPTTFATRSDFGEGRHRADTGIIRDCP